MTKAEALQNFRENIAPLVKIRYGDDRPAMREAWNDYTDGLYKDGQISRKQFDTWTGPYK